MQSSTRFWLIVIIVIAIFAGYIVWPFWGDGPHPGLPGRTLEVKTGLDVQGGLRVLLAAQSAQPPTAEQMAEVRRVIERRVNALGVAEPVVQLAGNNRVIVELPGERDPQRAIDLIQQTALLEFVDFSRIGGCTAEMPPAGAYVLTDRQILLRGANPNASPTPATAATAEATVAATSESTAEATTAATAEPTREPTKAVSNVRMRLAQTTPTVVPTAEATTEPTSAATPVPTSTPAATAVPTTTAEATAAATAAATAEATAEATAAATPGADVPGGKNNPFRNPCTGQPFRTVATGSSLSSADAGLQSGVQWVVEFGLSGNDEARAFTAFTQSNINQQLAIVVDGEVLSAPVVQNAIVDRGTITGNFTRESAINLAVQLRSGALPVSLVIESREQVGASLGAQSVQQSIRAGLVGVVTVLLFMLLYYRWAGVAAVLGLLLFALINFALYKYIPVTLTLSAITGFLISIATAVDGNILIFERMKEELRAGRPVLKAIELGFSRAWPSIRESNISTILIALVLYFFGGQFGASAVRGFAITLIIGLVTNLFTAVVATRVFLSLIVSLRGQRTQTKLMGE